ncbi:hypothetical protein CH063_12005 [Colletotrichum higginsianum]|uniref:Uncharacterized protein n=1 Tax=Colletotrichum higginsianum (strain IMI 349063) TaxID=759273 RepID=H1VNQ0_COLHI|nr:hypothetical protein CH063_12005 [Colletotrichum higginsianum]
MPLYFVSNTCVGQKFDTLAAATSFLAADPAAATTCGVVDADAFLVEAPPALADEVGM